MTNEVNSKAAVAVKTARCVTRDVRECFSYVECATCVRPLIPDALKQPWQFEPAPKADGTCPSWTDTIVKADPTPEHEGDPYLTASLASGGEVK